MNWMVVMQILPLENSGKNKAINISHRKKSPSFGSFLRYDSVARCTLDSMFYRENDALLSVIRAVEKNFPKGAEILDFACSNGEEAISIFSQLKDRAKYFIRAFDISPEAIAHERAGIHSVFSGCFDSFILDKHSVAKKAKLRDLFFSVMEPVESPNIAINKSTAYFNFRDRNPEFTEKYFRVKDEHASAIEYRKGDIRSLEHIETQRPVGAILFRNAFYHLCNNKILEALQYKINLASSVDKREAAQSLVRKIYDKLDKKGVFAIGEHFKDNIFVADLNAPVEKTVRFAQSKFFHDKYMASGNVMFMKKSPLVEALEEGDRFSPIHYSAVEFLGRRFLFPTVWQKVK